MIVVCLIVANVANLVWVHYLGHGRVESLELDREGNIPTFYSAVTLLVCGGLLAGIATARRRLEKRDWFYWALLALVFVLLSVDEAAVIHEHLGSYVRTALSASDDQKPWWVIPYGIVVIVMVLIFFRFLLSVPARIRYLIVVAGILYVGSALGLELVETYVVEHHGGKDVVYDVLATCEESLEMAGVLVFIYALMSYITSELNGLSLRIGAGGQPGPGIR